MESNKKESSNEYKNRLLTQIDKARFDNSNYSGLTSLDIAKKIFGFYGFKQNGQEEIINYVLEKKKNILGILPTGGGKSACYQIPALMREGITVVVSPLISLMKDQVESLVEKKVYSAFYLNSSVEEDTKSKIIDLIEGGKVRMLYIAPESLQSTKIQEILVGGNINLIVIDEAHCISTWGHNFRPDYLKLSTIIENLGSPPVLALTATATKKVEKDIKKQLNKRFKVIKASFDRPSLYLVVHGVPDEIDKTAFLTNLIKSLNGPTVVFARTRDLTENLAGILNHNGVNTTFYHAGLSSGERGKIQDLFMKGKCNVIVATIAFGMGIDKKDIRNIVHYNVPQSVENYYQEVGRAGRDGEKANCILLFTGGDVNRMKALISMDWPDRKKVEDIIEFLKNKPNNFFFGSAKSLSYEMDIKEIPAKLIAHRLEETGIIKTYSKVKHDIRVQFNYEFEEIIRRVDKKYKEDLNNILFSKCFEHIRSRVNFEVLMNQTGLNYFRILEIFNYLSESNFIRESDENHKDLILISKKFNSFNIEPIVKLFQDILDTNYEKVDELVKCLSSKGCIRKNILSYFDEPNLKNSCEMCSRCLTFDLVNAIPLEVNENFAKDEEIENLSNSDLLDENDELHETILKCIASDKSVPQKDFVNLLKGTLHRFSSKWKFKLNSYNLLPNVDSFEVEDNLNKLISDELVQVTIEGYLRITKKGITYLEGGLEISNDSGTAQSKRPSQEMPNIALVNPNPSPTTKSHSFDEIRKTFPKAYMKWTEKEDTELKKEYETGKSTKEIAKIFGRNGGSIRSRLRKIGLIE
jgi:ATP-dependent DNA helicase RecQ